MKSAKSLSRLTGCHTHPVLFQLFINLTAITQLGAGHTAGNINYYMHQRG